MDLRKEFDAILKGYGHHIFLRRVDNPFEGNEEVRYRNVLEKHTVRHMISGSATLMFQQNEEAGGLIFGSDVIYYFRWNVNPGPQDQIYENLDLPPEDRKIYSIDQVMPMRGDGGRVEYWVAGATKIYPD